MVNHNSINSSTIHHEKRSRSTNTKRLSWTKPANTAITTAAYGKHANFEDFLNDYGNKLGRFDTWSGVLASGIRGFTQGMLAGNDFAGFSSEDIDHVNAVAGFGANMAAGGFEFATTGKRSKSTKVNFMMKPARRLRIVRGSQELRRPGRFHPGGGSR